MTDFRTSAIGNFAIYHTQVAGGPLKPVFGLSGVLSKEYEPELRLELK
jgi:hypothetical protein